MTEVRQRQLLSAGGFATPLGLESVRELRCEPMQLCWIS